jgi:hypothetical protein
MGQREAIKVGSVGIKKGKRLKSMPTVDGTGQPM